MKRKFNHSSSTKEKKYSQPFFDRLAGKSKLYSYLKKKGEFDQKFKEKLKDLESSIKRVYTSFTFYYTDEGENKDKKVLNGEWVGFYLPHNINLDTFIYELKANKSFYIIVFNHKFTPKNLKIILKYSKMVDIEVNQQPGEKDYEKKIKKNVENVCLFQDMSISGIYLPNYDSENLYLCNNVEMKVKKVYTLRDRMIKDFNNKSTLKSFFSKQKKSEIENLKNDINDFNETGKASKEFLDKYRMFIRKHSTFY
jgi:hypothetical protein